MALSRSLSISFAAVALATIVFGQGCVYNSTHCSCSLPAGGGGSAICFREIAPGICAVVNCQAGNHVCDCNGPDICEASDCGAWRPDVQPPFTVGEAVTCHYADSSSSESSKCVADPITAAVVATPSSSPFSIPGQPSSSPSSSPVAAMSSSASPSSSPMPSTSPSPSTSASPSASASPSTSISPTPSSMLACPPETHSDFHYFARFAIETERTGWLNSGAGPQTFRYWRRGTCDRPTTFGYATETWYTAFTTMYHLTDGHCAIKPYTNTTFGDYIAMYVEADNFNMQPSWRMLDIDRSYPNPPNFGQDITRLGRDVIGVVGFRHDGSVVYPSLNILNPASTILEHATYVMPAADMAGLGFSTGDLNVPVVRPSSVHMDCGAGNHYAQCSADVQFNEPIKGFLLLGANNVSMPPLWRYSYKILLSPIAWGCS